MKVSVAEAGERLADLVRRAETGEEVIITLDGLPAVQLMPVRRKKSQQERRAILEKFQIEASSKILPGPSAARSQDFLYGDDGLPV